MKPASAALQTYLNGLGPSSPALFADLVTFALVGGQVLRYSMAQYPLSPPANSFQGPDASGNGASINYAASTAPVSFPLGPGFSRVHTKVKLGLDPDRAELAITPHPPGSERADFIGTNSWQQAAQFGFFDGATVEIDRLFMPAIGDYSLGSFVLHLGRVGQLKIGRTQIQMEVPNLLFLLSQQYPRRVFQPACSWVFGDANCTYDRSLNAQAVAAAAGSTQAVVSASFTVSPATLYNQGTIEGTAGANAGIARTIASAAAGSPGTIAVMIGFPYPIAAGDAFTLLPGCDRTLATCNGTFANLIHFGGFPYIPPPESAV
jgi:uncharacterized phage protein (TIGR02218 family)